MTPILEYLFTHYMADWKQAEPRTPGVTLSLWFEEPNTCAYLKIGESKLYVRWRKGVGGQYGANGMFRTCSRKELNESIPSIVAGVALNEAKYGRPVPEVPEWAKAELLAQGVERYADFKRKASTARALAASLDSECALLSAALGSGI